MLRTVDTTRKINFVVFSILELFLLPLVAFNFVHGYIGNESLYKAKKTCQNATLPELSKKINCDRCNSPEC